MPRPVRRTVRSRRPSGAQDDDVVGLYVCSRSVHVLAGDEVGRVDVDAGRPVETPAFEASVEVLPGTESVSVIATTGTDDLAAVGTTLVRFPGTAEGNWEWRCTADQLESFPVDRLRELTADAGRLE